MLHYTQLGEDKKQNEAAHSFRDLLCDTLEGFKVEDRVSTDEQLELAGAEELDRLYAQGVCEERQGVPREI